MSQVFNKAAFEVAFAASLIKLTNSERVSKEELKELSRSTLNALHNGGTIAGDIGYINKLILVLTPMNKKAAILYFKHFSGFSFDDELSIFTKKSKKRYDAAANESMEFLAEPHNNIWTWAERNIEVEQRKFTVESITETTKTMLTKAANNGISKHDVIMAIIAGGLEIETLLGMMDELGYAEVVEGAKG